MPDVSVPSPREARQRWFAFRTSRIRWPEWVVGVSGVVLLIALFLPSWFTQLKPEGGTGFPKPYISVSENGWHGLSHAHWLLLVTIVVAFLLLLLQATRRAPALPATFSLITLFLAALSLIWLIVRVPIDPAGGRDFGGWLALVSAAVLTWAAYKSFRMEGISTDDAPVYIPTIGLDRIAARDSESDQT